MHQPTFQVEEGRIRHAGKGPFAPHLSRLDINFDKQPAVACHIQKIASYGWIKPNVVIVRPVPAFRSARSAGRERRRSGNNLTMRKRLLRTAVQMIKLTATREITPGALGRLFWIPQVGFGIQAPSDHIPPRCRCSFFNTCAIRP
jgi:hypothetical protein